MFFVRFLLFVILALITFLPPFIWFVVLMSYV